MHLKKLHENATFKKAHQDDIGFDLIGCSFKYAENGLWLIGLGLSGQPSANQYIEIVPRSSFSKTPFIMPNNIGIIDPNYRGEWQFPVRFTNRAYFLDEGYPDLRQMIEKFIKSNLLNKRIAQAIPRSIVQIFPEWVDELEDTERGAGGFGSSGE